MQSQHDAFRPAVLFDLWAIVSSQMQLQLHALPNSQSGAGIREPVRWSLLPISAPKRLT